MLRAAHYVYEVRRIGWLVVLLSAACTQKPPPKENEGPPPLEPIFPEVSAGPKAALPAWAAKLPKRQVTAKPGDRVWATPPRSGTEMAEIGVFKVVGAYGEVATLVNTLGRQIDDVPGAVIHAIGQMKRLRKGDPALFYTWTTPAWLGRVKHAKPGQELRVKYDAAGQTIVIAVHHAEPIRTQLVPLAYAGFPKAGRTSMGTIVALGDKDVWLRTSSGHIEIHRRSGIEILSIPNHPLYVGQRVRAYDWATGLRPGAIKKVLENGNRYSVAIDGEAPRIYFFTRLVR